MALIAGVDLGTSTSEIAIFENGQPRVLVNDRGHAVTPSAIWTNPASGEIVVGHIAYQQAGAVRQYKRKMGTDFAYEFGGKRLLPEECTAHTLRYLLHCAGDVLGRKIDSVVLSVPANWKDAPRRATEAAGGIAGVEVARLINEPTAAAMAFGLKPDADGKTVAIFDFGGGTFDVTVLRIRDGIFDVLTSNGDAMLGGADIDQGLRNLVVEKHNAKSAQKIDLALNADAAHFLLVKCEEAKKELSFGEEFQLLAPFLPLSSSGLVGVDLRVTRQELHGIVDPLVDRALAYVEKGIRDAKLDPRALDEIVLVGGTTRIPRVRERVAEFFGKAPNSHSVNPEEAVALGAAVQASILSDDDSAHGAVLLDVTSATLGVQTLTFLNGMPFPDSFSPIIEKDSKIPRKNTERYVTTFDGQEQVEVCCFQGEDPVASRNAPVGEPILVSGLPQRPAGEVAVDVTFGISTSGMLEVDVAVLDTAIRANKTFSVNRSKFSEEEVARKRAELDDSWRRSDLFRKYRTLIERAEEILARDTVPAATRQRIAAGMSVLQDALRANDTERAEDADLALSEILFDVEVS